MLQPYSALAKPIYSIESDKSIICIGSDSGFSGSELRIEDKSNIIIRNCNIKDAYKDGIGIQNPGAHHIWVDHCLIEEPSGSNSSNPDGCLDIKRQADLITVSYTIFSGCSKTMLIGADNSHTDDIGKLRTTLYGNWFHSTEERHPRVRFARPVHVFNNYFFNIPENGYGVASTMGADVFVERNYFEDVVKPTRLDVGMNKDGWEKGYLSESSNKRVNSGTLVTDEDREDGEDMVPPSNFYEYDLYHEDDVKNLVNSAAGPGRIVRL